MPFTPQEKKDEIFRQRREQQRGRQATAKLNVDGISHYVLLDSGDTVFSICYGREEVPVEGAVIVGVQGVAAQTTSSTTVPTGRVLTWHSLFGSAELPL